MERQKIAGIFANSQSLGGQEMTVCGWVRTVRDMKNFGFIELNDGSSFGRSLNGFMRLNAACPRSVLKQAMTQLEAAVNAL